VAVNDVSSQIFMNGGQLIKKLIRKKQAKNLMRLILVSILNENLFNNITTHKGASQIVSTFM